MTGKRFGITLLGLFAAGSLRAEEGQEVFVHPFAESSRDIEAPGGSGDSFLNLRGSDQVPLSLFDRSQRTLRAWGMPKRIQGSPRQLSNFSLLRQERLQTVETSFTVDGFPLCQYQVKTHETLDGRMVMLGQFPRIEVDRTFTAQDWAEDEQLYSVIAGDLAMRGLDPNFRVDAKARCLWVHEGQLRPVWTVDVESERLLYAFVADESQVLQFSPKHFHARAGKAFVYPNNATDGDVEEFPLRGMKDTGFLENDHFITCVPSASGDPVCPPEEAKATPYAMVKEPSLTYNFDPLSQESQFIQTSVFTHANRALEWFEDHGYDNFGDTPILLGVHASFSGDPNNALYVPRSTFPMIFIGDGDGEVLQNLSTDADVVSHELAHHVVYHSIKQIEGESLVLHEGLADFFTFARTGNPCLGESICPDTSIGARVCAVPRQCLRSAENNLTLGGPGFPREPHLRGQLISGMLWDLHKKDGLGLSDVTRLVLKTIDLMVANSGYQHFVVGLLFADHAMFQGNNCPKILSRAQARGFQSLLSGVSCESVRQQSSGGGTDAKIDDYLGTGRVADTRTPVSEGRKGGKNSCGVIAAGVSGQNMSGLLVLLLPFLAMLIRRFRG